MITNQPNYESTLAYCKQNIANKFFENVTKFKYLRATESNRNYILDEVKSTFNFGITQNHSAQTTFIFPSRIFKIHKAIILAAVYMAVKIYTSLLETRLMASEKIWNFFLSKRESNEAEKISVTRNFIICRLRFTDIIMMINSRKMISASERCSTHGIHEQCNEILAGKHHLRGLGVMGRQN